MKQRNHLWQDLTQNPITGHYVGKDFFKTVSYALGVVYLFLLVPALLLATKVLLPLEVGIVLLGNGLSLDIIKEVKGYNLRRTADGAGNALATPESVLPPEEPILMPQAPADAETTPPTN